MVSHAKEISNPKILVTGAGGFIGSHVVELLLQHDHRVRALVHYNSAEGTVRIIDRAKKHHFFAEN